jgi:hypothetical protein
MVSEEEVLKVCAKERPEWRMRYSHRYFYMSWGADTLAELRRIVSNKGLKFVIDNSKF